MAFCKSALNNDRINILSSAILPKLMKGEILNGLYQFPRNKTRNVCVPT